jgi:hypothetical protein
MCASRSLRSVTGIAAALVVAFVAVTSAHAASPPMEIRQINSSAGQLRLTDIGVARTPGTSVTGNTSHLTYPIDVKNYGPHSSEVEVEATCGFVNSTSGGSAGSTVEKFTIFVVNQQTRHLSIECSGPGDVAGVKITVRPTQVIESNPGNNMIYVGTPY